MMPTTPPPPPDPPLSREQEDAVKRERQLADDARALVPARRTRLRDRLSIRPKEQFVREFVADSRVAGYPVVEEEVADANEVDYKAHYPGESLVTVVEREVRRCYERHEFPGQSARSVACDILNSSSGSFLFSLRGSPEPSLSTELVLAHLETLGFELPPPVAFSVAVRVTLALLNRDLMSDADGEESTPF
jgi:hypothetical protein